MEGLIFQKGLKEGWPYMTAGVQSRKQNQSGLSPVSPPQVTRRWSHRGTCTLPEQHHCSPGRSSTVLWLLHQTTAKRLSASPVPILRTAGWLQLLVGTSITLESRTKRNTACSHHKSRKWQEKCCDQGSTKTATAFSLSSMASTKANQKTGHLPVHALCSL